MLSVEGSVISTCEVLVATTASDDELVLTAVSIDVDSVSSLGSDVIVEDFSVVNTHSTVDKVEIDPAELHKLDSRASLRG